MAKFDDTRAREVFAPHLHPAEQLKFYAYGVKQPNIMIIILLTALAIIPGIIATFMLTKNYLIGLTGSRLIILEIKSIANPEVQSITEYSLSELQSLQLKTSTGAGLLSLWSGEEKRSALEDTVDRFDVSAGLCDLGPVARLNEKTAWLVRVALVFWRITGTVAGALSVAGLPKPRFPGLVGSNLN